MSSQFAGSMFKGRIGEAVVEAVLLEFGYQVKRNGQEFAGSMASDLPPLTRSVAPDLLVTDPSNGTAMYVEVKYRSSRPMSVILGASQLDNLRKHYPETILTFVSSYSGSVNCARVDQLTPDSSRYRNGMYAFDLMDDVWMPLWHYFPLVTPGEQLKRLWSDLQLSLHTFAGGRISRDRNGPESFPGEREDLESYISGNWSPAMSLYVEGNPDVQRLTLDELWEEARKIEAYLFSLDLLGEENVGTYGFDHTFNRILGQVGEHLVTIDLEELRKALDPFPDLLKKFDAIRVLAEFEHASVERNAPTISKLLSRFIQTLPSGLGQAYLLPEKGTLDNAIQIDFRTMFGLMQKRNRLDADN